MLSVAILSSDVLSNAVSTIMGLMMLAAGPGTTVTVSAIGPEAQAAVDAIAGLVADKFNEEGV